MENWYKKSTFYKVLFKRLAFSMLLYFRMLLFAFFSCTLVFGISSQDDFMMRPLTCRDILFGTLESPIYNGINEVIRFAYIQCASIVAMESNLLNASNDQKKKILSDISRIKFLLNPALMAIQVGYFIGRNTDLVERLNEYFMDNENTMKGYYDK